MLGWFYYAAQVKKQQSTERQQLMKIENEKQKTVNENTMIQEDKSNREFQLQACEAEAEFKKKDSIKYWGEYQDKTCTDDLSDSGMRYCLEGVLEEMEEAEGEEKTDKVACLKKYPL